MVHLNAKKQHHLKSLCPQSQCNCVMVVHTHGDKGQVATKAAMFVFDRGDAHQRSRKEGVRIHQRRQQIRRGNFLLLWEVLLPYYRFFLCAFSHWFA